MVARRKTVIETAEEGQHWMNVEEVARYLNLHLMTVYRMLQTGLIPAHKIGGRWRINRKELDEWFEQQGGGTRKAVLVVDDDPAVGKLFKRALQQEQCSIDVVSTGEEAVQQAMQKTYDLVFLDLLLPDMDGARTFAQLRKIDPDANVVLITAYPDSDLVGKAMKHGAVSLLIKPLPVAEIKRLVRSVHKRLPRRPRGVPLA